MNEINSQLIKESDIFVEYLRDLQNNLSLYDKTHTYIEQIEYIMKLLPSFKSAMDEHFSKTSVLFDGYDKDAYKTNQEYYIKKMWNYLHHPKINKHIYDKPFGYPGDFVIMNYILDYQNDFIGDSSYERLINYYSLKLPFCLANVARKEYIKSIIKKIVRSILHPSITSVACGSIRELLDLREGQVEIGEINCIDFEPKAFEYIKNELKTKPFPNNTRIEFIQKDILEMVKMRTAQAPIKAQDMIYFSGIFDYLPDRIAKKVFGSFYSLLKDGGTMLICNCSKKHKKLHSYYEVLGKWEMVYRDEEDLVNIISDTPTKKHRFEYPKNGECYSFLVIEK